MKKGFSFTCKYNIYYLHSCYAVYFSMEIPRFHVWVANLFQAYDQHLNMILGDVEEIVTSVEIDDETYEEIVRVCSIVSFVLHFAFLFSCSSSTTHRIDTSQTVNIESLVGCLSTLLQKNWLCCNT